MFHDRVIEAGKWLVGHFRDVAQSRSYSRDLIVLSRTCLRKTRTTYLFMFAESFRAYAVAACQSRGLGGTEEIESRSIESSCLCWIIKHAVPPRVDVPLDGAQLVSMSQNLEFIAQASCLIRFLRSHYKDMQS